MDDKKLENLLTVINSGSLSRAAAELDYTQPALSQMMNSLERELGCRLLERGHNGIALTPEGKSLLPYIEACVDTAVQLRSAASQISTRQRKIIRIGAYPSITQSWLSVVIKEFQQYHPWISIQLQVGGYDIQRWLRTGEIDLAFLDEGMRGKYSWIPLQVDPYLAVVPVSCPLSVENSVCMEQLLEYPLLLADLNELQFLPERYQIRNHLQVDATDDASILSIVEQGIGVTVLPRSSLVNLSDKLRAVPLYPEIQRTLGVAYPSRSIKWVMDLIKFAKQWIERL